MQPVHTGPAWGQFLFRFGQGPVWTGFFPFGEEQTTITCTIDIFRKFVSMQQCRMSEVMNARYH